MQPGDRIQKSANGRAALAGRSQELTPALRTLLLVIYGDKTAAEFSEVASRLPAGREGLQRLFDLGLIEVVPTLATLSGRATPAAAPDADAEALQAPLAEVTPTVATHSIDEAALQRLLYPEFVRAVADLGLRGLMLQMKVERAMSAEDLLALRGQVEAALGKAKGEEVRAEFARRIDFLIDQ